MTIRLKANREIGVPRIRQSVVDEGVRSNFWLVPI